MNMEDQIAEEQAPAPGRSSTTTIILIIVAILIFVLCIMPICTIAILTLLGPNIGDVFSQITAGLAATPLP